ncbi:MAG: hypothetical protein R3Y13_00915 [bacterium]
MEKKKINYFKLILNSLIILFILVYISGTSGYYEKTISNQTKLTDEAIRKFEEDIFNGNIIDLNNYKLEEESDYSNVFTNVGESLDKLVINTINDGFKGVSDFFVYLFT